METKILQNEESCRAAFEESVSSWIPFSAEEIAECRADDPDVGSGYLFSDNEDLSICVTALWIGWKNAHAYYQVKKED